MMKKLIYSLFSAALFLASCSEMDDINKEVDRLNKNKTQEQDYLSTRDIAPEAYTLVDADYELSSNKDVSKYKNFSKYALPKDYLPEILNQRFSGENAQEMFVTYNFYSSVVTDYDNAYVLTDGDYEVMGQKYGNFDDKDEAESKIAKLLDSKDYYNTIKQGTEKTVEYTFFSAGDNRYVALINEDSAVSLKNEPKEFYELDSADYEFLGANYYNFSDINSAFEQLQLLAVERGHVLPKNYKCKVYRNYYNYYAVFRYTQKWETASSVMEVTEPLNYALDKDTISNSTWWADPAIKIELGKTDYDLFPETANYQNFDLRSGKVPGTDVAKRVEMIGTMLDTNHSPIVEDQQYLVSYKFYDGGSGVGSDRIVKMNGAWSMYKEP